jgi:NAD(P)-dependent dehydrogenase (short-subunit alcohol dehydrogenase family)
MTTTLITGAASGLGRALALEIAAPGVTLHLGDRNGDGVEQTAILCRGKGATVFARSQDVTDNTTMASWIGGCGRLDMVIGCAGVQFTSLFGAAESAAETRATIDINLIGAINTALPALDIMAAQPAGRDGRRGQIALLASLGCFVAVPGASTYCASKAAVDSWVVGRAALARRQGVWMTSICPGYIRTPLTSINDFTMPGLMEADYAARTIVRRLRKAPVRLAFPWRMVLAAKFGGLLPAGFPARMLARNYARAHRLPDAGQNTRPQCPVRTGVAVVTGASGGIGRWIARGLAEAGCHVVMVGRNGDRLKAAEGWIRQSVPGARTEAMVVDLASLAQTRALGQSLRQRHPAIEILVNNAGVFLHRREVTAEGHEKVLAVNHLAPFVLTNELLPALAAAGRGRVVTIGSSTSDRATLDPDNLELARGWNMVSAYRRSKLAQMMTTFELSERSSALGVTANVVHPGAVATGLVRAGGPIGIAWRLMAPFLLTEQQGAETPLFVALAAELDGVSGRYFKRRTIVTPNPRAMDAELRRRVWDETARLAGDGIHHAALHHGLGESLSAGGVEQGCVDQLADRVRGQ